MFKEKMLCLLMKSGEQIEKEAKRRGISLYCESDNPANPVKSNKSRERLIMEIVYKDAYDDGRNNPVDTTCPENCPGRAVPEYTAYRIINGENDYMFRIELTEEQNRLLDWLAQKELLGDCLIEEWNKNYEDCGKI